MSRKHEKACLRLEIYGCKQANAGKSTPTTATATTTTTTIIIIIIIIIISPQIEFLMPEGGRRPYDAYTTLYKTKHH